MKKSLLKSRKKVKDEPEKQGEALMGFNEFVCRIVCVKPREIKPKRA